MNIPLQLIRRLSGRVGFAAVVVGMLIAAVSTVVAVVAIIDLVDGEQVADIWHAGRRDPRGWVVAFGGFGLAFLLRSLAWVRILPGLRLRQSMAAIHVALGANHVLPFRLGEPLRVVSAVRRSNLSASDAALTGGLLRIGDILSLVIIGLVLAPGLAGEWLGPWGLGVVAVLAVVGAVLAWRVVEKARRQSKIRTPDLLTFGFTIAAWLSEAILVDQVARWAGVELTYADALLVTALAVSAQLVAVAPGGIGTYELAASAALIASGVPASAALPIAMSAHILKTAYSLTTGVIAVFLPRPGLLGRFRLPSQAGPRPSAPLGNGPVVLFLPAFQEGPRIAEVISRAPETCLGLPLEVLVIDDGSTDDTVEQASKAGATVVTSEVNRGLGHAVQRGFVEAVDRFDASVVVFCDADGEYDPADIESLVAPIIDGSADYVVGSRFAGEIEHMRPHRRFGNLTLTRWVRWMTRRPVTDGQSGYRALSAHAASSVDMAHDYNYAQVLTLDLLRQGFVYREVPITYRFRESGESFVKLGRYLRAVLPAVWRVLNRPENSSVFSSSVLNSSVLNDEALEPGESSGPASVVPSAVES